MTVIFVLFLFEFSHIEPSINFFLKNFDTYFNYYFVSIDGRAPFSETLLSGDLVFKNYCKVI